MIYPLTPNSQFNSRRNQIYLTYWRNEEWHAMQHLCRAAHTAASLSYGRPCFLVRAVLRDYFKKQTRSNAPDTAREVSLMIELPIPNPIHVPVHTSTTTSSGMLAHRFARIVERNVALAGRKHAGQGVQQGRQVDRGAQNRHHGTDGDDRPGRYDSSAARTLLIEKMLEYLAV